MFCLYENMFRKETMQFFTEIFILSERVIFAVATGNDIFLLFFFYRLEFQSLTYLLCRDRIGNVSQMWFANTLLPIYRKFIMYSFYNIKRFFVEYYS